MSVSGSKTQHDVLKSHVLSTNQRYSVYYLKEQQKPKNTDIQEAKMRAFKLKKSNKQTD